MFCPGCGKENVNEAKFCSSCGHSYHAKVAREYVAARSFPLVVSVALLVFALFAGSVDIGFFTFLRWVISASTVYYLYVIYKNNQGWGFWVWVLALLAILFNPLVPIYLDRDVWHFFDLIAAVLLSIYWYKLRKEK